MEINFGQTLKTLDGTQMQNDKKEPLTLRYVCESALLSMDPQAKIGGPEKMKRYDLARKIHDGKDPVRVDAGEIVTLKEQIGETYLPLVVGQAYKMLEQEVKPPEEK
jgi:hypothetical protein